MRKKNVIKETIFALLFLGSTAGLVSNAASTESASDVPYQIEIREKGGGDGDDGVEYEKEYAVPIEGSVFDGKIDIQFKQNLGNVSISLINSTIGSTVFKNSVNTTLKNQTTIDISTIPTGAYRVEFKDALGNTSQSSIVNVE